MNIYSEDVWIVCPCTNDRIKIHACVLMKCRFEKGHSISDSGSYVNCGFLDGEES
jgi:hypothetical protein